MSVPKYSARLAVALLLTPLLALAPASVRAEEADFSGKTVEWIVPFKPGGGTDRWARFYAPLLSRHLPGNPKVVVKNVPGGGSTTGANQFARRARPDGLSLLGSSTSTLFPYLLGDPRVEYDYNDWRVLLVSPTGGVVYARPDLAEGFPYDLTALKSKPLTFGSQGAASLDIIMLLAMELLGVETRAVFGMSGRGAGRLSFERGETVIDYQTSAAYLQHVIPLRDKGKATALMSWGTLDANGYLIRDLTFPRLPHFAEVFRRNKGDSRSPAYSAWKALFAAGYPAQKMLLLPRETPNEIVTAYHRAFEEIFKTEEFQIKSENALGKYRQFTGARAAAMKKIAATMKPEAREWTRNWLREKYQVEF